MVNLYFKALVSRCMYGIGDSLNNFKTISFSSKHLLYCEKNRIYIKLFSLLIQIGTPQNRKKCTYLSFATSSNKTIKYLL